MFFMEDNMKRVLSFLICLLTLLLLLSSIAFAEHRKTFKIYLDADRTGTKASGLSIEQGIRLALSEVDYEISGCKIEIVIRDHHGSSKRSSLHLQEFVEDDEALAVFCGLHSPPVLANLDFINQNKILLLDPWAAAGPITRTIDEQGKNWIFRLSIDDNRAGEVITAYSVDVEGLRKPVLLLEDTGWGRSNKSNMITALNSRNLEPLDIIWFNWNIGISGAKQILNDIYTSGADVIFLVANAPEGITFVQAMADRGAEDRLPIRSHWGITGGSFFETLGADVLVNEVDLQFIQTSFSFLDSEQTAVSEMVFKRSISMFPEITEPEDIKSPCGLIHSYDLTKILIAAIEQIELTRNIVENRRLLRDALEDLETPVPGLLRVYNKPFSTYSEENIYAHEALGLQDFMMAEYTYKGGIRLLGR